MKKACLFVVSGPSAVGKNSVVNEILKIDRSLSRVVTCTTRPMRKSEKHGVDYFFMEKNNFLLEADRGNFIEFSEVYGNYYGVMLSVVKEKINAGEDSILVINWEGFLKIKNVIGNGAYGIFILPPSMEDLKLRIKSRGEDSAETMAHRISMAREDMEKSKFYDFCFKNSDIISTAKDILKTINGVRLANS
ncbi:MAG: guanylate kinase [Holosporaceae bacterium]|nr:guanylate kinase [Holosporaceae bacterium]